MATNLRFADPGEVDGAVANVKAWGYRELEVGEAEASKWAAVEVNGILVGWWWLQPDARLDGDALLHVCHSPSYRSKATKGTVKAFKWVAELAGVKRMWAVPPPSLWDYMRRLDWWEEPENGVFVVTVRK